MFYLVLPPSLSFNLSYIHPPVDIMCLQLLAGKVAPAIAGQYPRNNNNKQNQNKNNNNDNNYNNSRLISSTYFNQLFRLFKFWSTLQFKTDDEFRSRLWNMTKFSSPSLLLRHLRPRKKVRKNRIFGLQWQYYRGFFYENWPTSIENVVRHTWCTRYVIM